MPKGDQEKNPDLRQFSHDLRNELGTLYNYVQLLELSLTKKGVGKEVDIAREIAKSVKKIESLIEERIDSVSS